MYGSHLLTQLVVILSSLCLMESRTVTLAHRTGAMSMTLETLCDKFYGASAQDIKKKSTFLKNLTFI